MKNLLILSIISFLFFVRSESVEAANQSSDCPVLYEMTSWEYGDRWKHWSRRQNWYDNADGWITNTGVGIDFDPESKSYNIIKNKKSAAVIIYIGPWQKVTLTYPTHFWEEKKQIETEIRLIATQNKGTINSHFETKDEFNKDIPEQRLILLEPAGLLDLCKIRWADKFGYNAVANYKLNPWRFFTGEVLVGDGKIIDSETGEIIADEKGKILKKKE